MVYRASQRSAGTTLCTSPPHPVVQILGPPGNSFPETWLPGENDGRDKSTSVSGKGDCLVLVMTVLRGASILSDMMWASLSDFSGCPEKGQCQDWPEEGQTPRTSDT